MSNHLLDSTPSETGDRPRGAQSDERQAQVSSSGQHEALWAIEFNKVYKSFSSLVCYLISTFRCGWAKVTLIGPRGSGKTTVLRLAMTLMKPTSGDIHIFGESILVDKSGEPVSRAQSARIRRRCGMVFQQFYLFPHLTVMQNLILAPTTVLRHTRAEAEAGALRYLRMVGLEGKARAYPAQLSGGQQQWIAIARALVMKPEVLLLDEITSALDPEIAGEVLDVVRGIAHDSGMSMLIVTHEMRFASQISDRIVVFESGEVVEQARPKRSLTTRSGSGPDRFCNPC